MLLLKLTKPIFEANWKAYDAYKIITKPDIKQWLADSGAVGEPRLLGSGGYGWVYKVGDKVVKLTKDELEAKNSKLLMSRCNHPNMVKVWNVRSSNCKVRDMINRESEIFLILQDYADPKKIDADLAQAADLVGGYFDVEPSSFTQDIDVVIKGFMEYNSELFFYSDKAVPDNILKKSRMLFDIVRDIYRTCDFQYKDLHHDNIGYGADGVLKVFDYGLSEFTD